MVDTPIIIFSVWILFALIFAKSINFSAFSKYAAVKLSPKMTKYIKEKSGCSDESFWEAFEPNFVPKAKKNKAESIFSWQKT